MVPNDSPYPKTWGLKKNQVSSLLRSWVTPWRARPPPQTIVVDFPHHRVVFAGAHRVFWVGLCLNYPDHPKKTRKNRLCNPPPHHCQESITVRQPCMMTSALLGARLTIWTRFPTSSTSSFWLPWPFGALLRLDWSTFILLLSQLVFMVAVGMLLFVIYEQ